MELTISLQPKQREAIKASEKFPVTFMGGAKGGGKSYTIRAREIVRRLKYKDSKGLIIRKTYPELLANHIRPFFKEYPEARAWYNKAEKTIYYPNGATTEFSYLRNTDDVYTYQGREYEDISVDEVTQHEWEVIRVLRSSNRTTSSIPPTMFLTGNPGGIGHQEVKRIFIDRDFRAGESPEDFVFIPAFVDDNRALLDNDPDYVKRLKDLPDHLVKAYLYGDWNIFAGQAFAQLVREVHLIDPFEPPQDAKWFAGFDWGFTHPFAFVLCFITQEKKIYIHSVITAQKKEIDQQADLIRKLIGDKRMNVYAGTDIWSNRGGPTLVRELKNNLPNLTIIQANTDRVQGVASIRKLIAHHNSEPQLKIFRNASDVFENMASMQYSSTNPEDVLKVDANESGVGGDDIFDATRYALHTYLNPKVIRKEPPKPFSGEDLLKRSGIAQRLKL
jgi:phage terminase large subunit